MAFVLCIYVAYPNNTVNDMDNPSLEIDYGVVASYISAVRHPSDPTDNVWNLYIQVLETRIGYAPQGLLSRLLQCKCDPKQDSECMIVLFSLLISGFLPPTVDQHRSIKRILYAENTHELTNHILDDKEIGPRLEFRLKEI